MKPIDPRVNPELVPSGSKAIVIAEKQDEYIDLPSIRTPTRYDTAGRVTHPGYVITRWELTNEERAAVIRGEDVYVTIVTGGSINPLFVSIGPCDWKL